MCWADRCSHHHFLLCCTPFMLPPYTLCQLVVKFSGEKCLLFIKTASHLSHEQVLTDWFLCCLLHVTPTRSAASYQKLKCLINTQVKGRRMNIGAPSLMCQSLQNFQTICSDMLRFFVSLLFSVWLTVLCWFCWYACADCSLSAAVLLMLAKFPYVIMFGFSLQALCRLVLNVTCLLKYAVYLLRLLSVWKTTCI